MQEVCPQETLSNRVKAVSLAWELDADPFGLTLSMRFEIPYSLEIALARQQPANVAETKSGGGSST